MLPLMACGLGRPNPGPTSDSTAEAGVTATLPTSVTPAPTEERILATETTVAGTTPIALATATLEAAQTAVSTSEAQATSAVQATDAQGVGPEQRVQDFYQTFSGALNDPAIKETATQEQWAEQLAGFVEPNLQSQAQQAFQEYLATLGNVGAQIGQATGQGDLDVRVTAHIDGLQTRLRSETAETAEVELAAGTLKLDIVGADIEKLGPLADQVRRELPLTDLAGVSENNVIPMKNVDGVWYMDLQGLQNQQQ